MSFHLRARATFALALGSACTSVLAGDMPYMPDSPWKTALLVSCLPALLLVPTFVLRLVYVRFLADHPSDSSPLVTRWWGALALASLVPWVIVFLWLFID